MAHPSPETIPPQRRCSRMACLTIHTVMLANTKVMYLSCDCKATTSMHHPSTKNSRMTREAPTKPVSSPMMAKMKSLCASGRYPHFLRNCRCPLQANLRRPWRICHAPPDSRPLHVGCGASLVCGHDTAESVRTGDNESANQNRTAACHDSQPFARKISQQQRGTCDREQNHGRAKILATHNQQQCKTKPRTPEICLYMVRLCLSASARRSVPRQPYAQRKLNDFGGLEGKSKRPIQPLLPWTSMPKG